jgi:site-specific recombinase XerC
MPNPRLPLDQFKDEIYNWIFIDCLKNKDIASLLSTRLGKPCSLRTLENRLQEWNFSQRNQVKDSVELRLQIAILFQQSYSDKNIVRQLS